MTSGLETILSILPGSSDDVRTVVAMRNQEGNVAIELRQESFSQAVGWFMQSRIELSAAQVADLRQTLGLIPARSRRPERSTVDNPRPATLAFPDGQRAAIA